MMHMSEEAPQLHHIVAYLFEGRNRAEQVIQLLKKARRDGEYRVPA
jgi:hypothetical protein